MRNREWLPHVIAGISLVVFIVLGLASATQPPPPMVPDAVIEVGTVQTYFDSHYTIGLRSSLDAAAHAALLENAMQAHGEHIYVVNVTWRHVGRGDIRGTGMGRGFRYSATGTVVFREGAPGAPAPILTGIEGALHRTVEGLARDFPARSRIAIANIVAADRGYADLIDGRLEHLLRIRGFDVFDRSQLDIVRAEQQLGLDFFIDEHTAVSIGRVTGVSVIITGRVVVAGNLRELQVRAVDTTTARLVGTALESF